MEDYREKYYRKKGWLVETGSLYRCIAPDGRKFWTTSLSAVWWWENSPPAGERETCLPSEDKPYKELINMLKTRGYKCRKIK